MSRLIDPVADMAFPAMDLAAHGRSDLAGASPTPTSMPPATTRSGPAPLYTAYRATVRAWWTASNWSRAKQSKSSELTARERARADRLLALTELESPGQKPCLILVTGLPGAGKS